METEKEKSDRYLANLEKHVEATKEAVRYSSDRFDVLLVTLSTGSLMFSMGFAENIVQDLAKADTSSLKTAWLLFAGSLISNLISQVSGYYANKSEIRVSKNLIRVERGKEAKGNQDRIKWWCQTLDYSTITLNALSLIAFICGIVALVRFSDTNV
jgi:hypothetical protein